MNERMDRHEVEYEVWARKEPRSDGIDVHCAGEYEELVMCLGCALKSVADTIGVLPAAVALMAIELAEEIQTSRMTDIDVGAVESAVRTLREGGKNDRG